MSTPEPSTMLVIASSREFPEESRVWGTGGWLEPEEREALDWMTFARLHGWSVGVARAGASPPAEATWHGSRWIIVACDPGELGSEWTALLRRKLESEALLVVLRAPSPGTPLATLATCARPDEPIEGRMIEWMGPGPVRAWRTRTPIEASALESTGTVCVTLEGKPLIAIQRAGRGTIASLGFHPSRARDRDGAMTSLLRHLLVHGSVLPVAWLDLEGTLVLRMDDPGGAQNIHLRSWSYPKLGEKAWAAIAQDLRKRNARLSVGYVAGWVDDGDEARGTLESPATTAESADTARRRSAGSTYPSPTIRYRDRAGHLPGTLHDYTAEYRGIQALRTAGLGDVELHGYTHLNPDVALWAKASDRYENIAWFRELGCNASAVIAARSWEEHPLALGVAALRRHFGVDPTTLIPPGDEWTTPVLERALDLGLSIVSSYYQALRDGDRWLWATHFCAPYLDKPAPEWFDAGLPVVGYFHDYELALEGVRWMSRNLERWQEAGARRLIDFRQLAAVIGRSLELDQRSGSLHLVVRNRGGPPTVRPFEVRMRVPGAALASRLVVTMDVESRDFEVVPLDRETGRVTIPPGLHRDQD